jgi:DNA-binding NarL/FixJ family response regulator
MRGPSPPMVPLTADERQGLEALVRRHTSAQQVALRARIILAAADGFNNAQIARQLGIEVEQSGSGASAGWVSRLSA